MSDIWYMLQDHERYVYHYTRASTLANHILASGKLRLSRFRDVNDPRESKDWVFHYHSMASDLGFDTRPIEIALNERLKHSQRLGCFVSDTYEALVTKQKEDRGEDILGAPYERGHSRPRMWAQYGENYAGACLVFEKAKLDAGIRSLSKGPGWKIYAGRVVYRNPETLPNLGRPSPLMISVDEVNRLGLAAAMDAHISGHRLCQCDVRHLPS